MTVTTPGGTSARPAPVTTTPTRPYLLPPSPLSHPTSGATSGGTSVTITGTNLTGATAVSFGGTAATGVSVVNATTVTAPARLMLPARLT